MDGKMTLETALSVIDRSIHALREAGYPAQADELTEARVPVSAQFAQPAQAVDVGVIWMVIDELNDYCEASDDSRYGTLSTSLVRDYTGRLTRAIGNAQAEVVAWISPGSLLGLKDEKHERVGGGYYSDAEVLSLPDDDTYIPLCIATQATPNAHE